MIKSNEVVSSSIVATATGDRMESALYGKVGANFITAVFGASDDYSGYLLAEILASIGENHNADIYTVSGFAH